MGMLGTRLVASGAEVDILNLTSDDIDINDPMDVEWAIATRVQGDKDIIVIPNSRAKPLDPSLAQGAGIVPTGAKVGIDATIPEGIPKEHYERITYAYADTAKIGDYVKGKTDKPGKAGVKKEIEELADKILALIEKEPHRISFAEAELVGDVCDPA